MEKSGADNSRRIVTIAGCKGGVGKSVIACSIALEMGRLGKDVILVDADLGGANLHTYLGIRSPKYVISDFLSRRLKTIEETVLATDYQGVRLISSAGNVPSQANPKFAQKAKLINSLRSLKADCIVVDIGAGSSYDVMDFFSMTDDGILVTTPEPSSIVNSYGFVKNVLYRKLSLAFRQYSLVTELLKRGMNPDGNDGISSIPDLMAELERVSPECRLKAKEMLSHFIPGIIVNMTASESDLREGEKLKAIINKFLSIEARCIGHVVEDPVLRISAKRMIPFVVFAPDCRATTCVKEIARRLTSATREQVRAAPQDDEQALGSGRSMTAACQ
ncbi:P-loop NTPase [Candidatus Poribacteria bacterium]|nr:P-loop NTPase [Candidatus Poribacteria bacterium]